MRREDLRGLGRRFSSSELRGSKIGELRKRLKGFAFRGIVCTGVGEGRYYLGLSVYREGLWRRLGFKPYRGTLNLKLPREWRWVRSYILERGERLEGFRGELGAVSFCRGKLAGEPVGVLVPERTVHRDVVEVVAVRRLRKVLALSDGDEVWVEIT